MKNNVSVMRDDSIEKMAVGMRYPGDFYYQNNETVPASARYAGDFYRAVSATRTPLLTCMKGSALRFAGGFYNKCA